VTPPPVAGCAIGVLTDRLAERCDAVVAWDCAPAAAGQARARCAGWPGVEVAVADVGVAWPAGSFDLVVVSELGYYFSVPRLAELRARAVCALERGGALVAVHWTGTSPDHLLHADEVHAVLGDDAHLAPVAGAVHPGFRVDVWRRR
jgi:hypothetical protein